MRGLSISSGKIEISDGSRVTFTTDGTLVNLLPASYDLNLSDIDFTYPDFTKSYAYYWSGEHTTSIKSEGCSTAITAVPQNWNNFSSPRVLGALPAVSGIDFLDILVYPRRTNTPSNWMGAAIPTPIQQNAWTDMGGGSSMIVEQALGMARSVTVQISGGNVVLLAQQSVADYPTGWWTTDPTENIAFTYGSNGRGLPVSGRDFKEALFAHWPGAYAFQRNGVGSTNPCATSDNTNYASNWRFDFRIAFGRRS